MISPARTLLLREWRRYVPAVLAVGFAGLLVFIQLALMLGIFGTVSVLIDRSRADLWVGYPRTPSVDLGRDIPVGLADRLRLNPEVAAIENFRWLNIDIRRPDGSPAAGQLFGIDPRPDGLLLARALPASLRLALEEPDTVLVDQANAANLQVSPGSALEINGKRVRVVGFTEGLGAIGGPNLVSSRITAGRLDPGDRRTTSYLVLRLRHPSLAAQVRDALLPPGPRPRFEIWTAEEFSRQSQRYWLLENGLGLGFVFSGLLALVVGIVITGQTLKAAVHAARGEYATLRAFGVSRRALRALVFEQAAWIGLVGVTVTTAVSLVLVRAARVFDVLVLDPAWAYAGAGGFMLLIALAAGLLALRELDLAEPARLLR